MFLSSLGRLRPAFLLVGSLLTACSSADDGAISTNVLVRNDFEQLDGWVPVNPSLTTEFAHSGRYSTKVGGDIEYSLTFIKPLGLISSKRFRKVKFSAWVYLPDAGAHAASL